MAEEEDGAGLADALAGTHIIDDGDDGSEFDGRSVNSQGEFVFGMREIDPNDAPISQRGSVCEPSFTDVWARWTDANEFQKTARGVVCAWDKSGPLCICAPPGVGVSTLITHAAAAYLASEPFSTVVIVTRDFRDPARIDKVFELFYETYVDDCFRLVHAPYALYAPVGDDRFLPSFREVNSSFARLTINHTDGLRRLVVTDDPALVPGGSPLTLIDRDALRYHDGAEMLRAARCTNVVMFTKE